MEIEIISRETIKPSSPTPPHLTIYPLSFIDHIVFRNYIPTLFFYDTHASHHHSITSTLKNSLSQLLSIYYPFAGRFRDQLSIHCNDQGLTFLVANIKSINLSQILRNPNQALLNPLFPDQLQWKEMPNSYSSNENNNNSLLAIQINRFECGGIAVSVCMCHKIGDAATLFNFVNDWSTINRQNGLLLSLTASLPVLDVGISLFPQGDLPVFPEVVFVQNDTVCRRFVFQASKIESLKAQARGNSTRVEVVTALIYKCAVSALGLNWKTTSLRTAVNLRKRMDPPVAEKTVGNLVWFLFVFNPLTEVEELVRRMKEGLREFCDTCAKRFGEKDLGYVCECMKQATATSEDRESETTTLICYASWCRFGMYEADFGWGKPVWVTTSGCPVRNSVVLMDTRDGNGIEALVNMEQNDMARFQKHEELLQYASLGLIP